MHMLVLTLTLMVIMILILTLILIQVENKPFLKKDKSIIFFLSSIIRNGVLKNGQNM